MPLKSALCRNRVNPYKTGLHDNLCPIRVREARGEAVVAGTIELKEPESKPWGQVVSYVRAPNGTLIELCSPVVGEGAA